MMGRRSNVFEHKGYKMNAVSAWLTAVVALITAAAGLAGSFIGASLQSRAAMTAARHQAAAAASVARTDRFASWQMHKREVYANLLRSMQKMLHTGDGQLGRDLSESLAGALVVAHKELRQHLMRLEADVSQIRDPSYRQDLVERLMADVRQTGANT
jgi:hypothetical protein